MTPVVLHPVAGTMRVLGVPVKLSATPGQIRHAAPLLGADTETVLAEMLGADRQG
jgi:crotonobetainyl-CoA:carnitine CoA-transferase CaiB-like acyl-CoA transferase